MLIALTIIAGITLIVLAAVGPRAGTAKDRSTMAIVGVGSIAYSVWVMHQTSGVFFFSILPIGWAVVSVLKVCGLKATKATGTKSPQAPRS